MFAGGYAGVCLVEDGIATICWVIERNLLLDDASTVWATYVEFLSERSSFYAAFLSEATPLWDKPDAVAAIPYGYLRDLGRGLSHGRSACGYSFLYRRRHIIGLAYRIERGARRPAQAPGGRIPKADNRKTQTSNRPGEASEHCLRQRAGSAADSRDRSPGAVGLAARRDIRRKNDAATRVIPQRKARLLPTRHRVAKWEEPFDLCALLHSRFGQYSSPIGSGKSARYRNRTVVGGQAIERQDAKEVFYEIIRQQVPVQIVDEPAAICMILHPLNETDEFCIRQMVREIRADDKVGAPRSIERKYVGRLVGNMHFGRRRLLGRLFRPWIKIDAAQIGLQVAPAQQFPNPSQHIAAAAADIEHGNGPPGLVPLSMCPSHRMVGRYARVHMLTISSS